MKKTLVILLAIVMVLSLSACGNSEKAIEEIRTELCGTWGYYLYADMVDEDCYQVYTFYDDGNVLDMWINEDSPQKNSNHEGSYTISPSDQKIIMNFIDPEKEQIIEYSYDDGNLRLLEISADGTRKTELERIE